MKNKDKRIAVLFAVIFLSAVLIAATFGSGTDTADSAAGAHTVPVIARGYGFSSYARASHACNGTAESV